MYRDAYNAPQYREPTVTINEVADDQPVIMPAERRMQVRRLFASIGAAFVVLGRHYADY